MKILDIGLALFLFGLILYCTYIQGRRDERFKRDWCCNGCGADSYEGLEGGLCFDCMYNRKFGEGKAKGYTTL